MPRPDTNDREGTVANLGNMAYASRDEIELPPCDRLTPATLKLPSRILLLPVESLLKNCSGGVAMGSRFGIDTSGRVSNSLRTQAAPWIGGSPKFWGRYFNGTSSAKYQYAES